MCPSFLMELMMPSYGARKSPSQRLEDVLCIGLTEKDLLESPVEGVYVDVGDGQQHKYLCTRIYLVGFLISHQLEITPPKDPGDKTRGRINFASDCCMLEYVSRLICFRDRNGRDLDFLPSNTNADKPRRWRIDALAVFKSIGIFDEEWARAPRKTKQFYLRPQIYTKGKREGKGVEIFQNVFRLYKKLDSSITEKECWDYFERGFRRMPLHEFCEATLGESRRAIRTYGTLKQFLIRWGYHKPSYMNDLEYEAQIERLQHILYGRQKSPAFGEDVAVRRACIISAAELPFLSDHSISYLVFWFAPKQDRGVIPLKMQREIMRANGYDVWTPNNHCYSNSPNYRAKALYDRCAYLFKDDISWANAHGGIEQIKSMNDNFSSKAFRDAFPRRKDPGLQMHHILAEQIIVDYGDDGMARHDPAWIEPFFDLDHEMLKDKSISEQFDILTAQGMKTKEECRLKGKIILERVKEIEKERGLRSSLSKYIEDDLKRGGYYEVSGNCRVPQKDGIREKVFGQGF